MLALKTVTCIALFITLALGLHLEVPSSTNPKPVCIRDFVQPSQLVVVNVKTNSVAGDGQKLNMRITDRNGNEYRTIYDVRRTANIAFTSQSTAFDICFTNTMVHKWIKSSSPSREIELDVETGASARDWNAVQSAEKLKPIELDLRMVEEQIQEISNELGYLKAREERMRDTNESTNSRVKWFSILIFLSLIGLGAWQIQYLRHYFKVKHII